MKKGAGQGPIFITSVVSCHHWYYQPHNFKSCEMSDKGSFWLKKKEVVDDLFYIETIIFPWYTDEENEEKIIWYPDMFPWYTDIFPWYTDIFPWYTYIFPWYTDEENEEKIIWYPENEEKIKWYPDIIDKKNQQFYLFAWWNCYWIYSVSSLIPVKLSMIVGLYWFLCICNTYGFYANVRNIKMDLTK